MLVGSSPSFGHQLITLGLHSLVRKEAILLNILHVRMLIKANTVILFDALGTTDSALMQQFVRALQIGLKAGYRASGGLPYEFRAVEVALTSVTKALEEEMKVHREAVDKLLGPLESHIGTLGSHPPSLLVLTL